MGITDGEHRPASGQAVAVGWRLLSLHDRARKLVAGAVIAIIVVSALRVGFQLGGGFLGTDAAGPAASVLGDAVSIVVPSAAVWLALRRPRLAAALALAPFAAVFFTSAWMLWWLVAQLAVVALTAVHSWREAVWPAAAVVASGAAISSVPTWMVVGPNVRYRQWAFSWGDWTWIYPHLLLLAVAFALPAAWSMIARERVVLLREDAVTAAAQVQAERARLAHDLHDVVAHHVSLIAVRAEAAPYTEPDLSPRAREVMAEIAEDARRALDELRGVLGVLHRAEQAPELAPQPGITDVPDLIARAISAGDQITARGFDTSGTIPDTVGYVIYRLVQESLTNARRYARGSRVEVSLEREGEDVVVTVTNEPPRRAATTSVGSGSGMVAMAERVEVLGGSVDAGPTPDGGFRVSARLPLTTPSR